MKTSRLLLALLPSLALLPGPRSLAIEISGKLDPYGDKSVRFENLFTPFTTERAALSPDGLHVAYTLRTGDKVYVNVVEIDKPGTLKSKILAIDDSSASEVVDETVTEKSKGSVVWMGWPSANRVVIETNQRSGVSVDYIGSLEGGAIFGFNADGSNAILLASERDFFKNVTRMTGPVDLFKTSTTAAIAPSSSPSTTTTTASNTTAADPTSTDGTTSSDEPIDSAMVSTRVNRSPHIVGYIPGNEEQLWVRSDMNTNDVNALIYTVAKMNVNKRKITDERDMPLNNREVTLLDRQGVSRITAPYSTMHPFPHRFSLMPSTFFGRDKKLDEIISGPKAGGFHLSPQDYLGHRSIPLGFDEDPSVLYTASNMGRDTFGIYSFDLKTGSQGKISVENPDYDLYEPEVGNFPDIQDSVHATGDREALVARVAVPSRSNDNLVFNRFTGKLIGIRYYGSRPTTIWINPEIARVQQELEQTFAGAIVTIQDWDKSLNRFLARIESTTTPGSFIVFDRTSRKLWDFVKVAPDLDQNHNNQVAAFGFPGSDGSKITGFITFPKRVRKQPVPIIVYCQSLPWKRVAMQYCPEVQAIADMGFAVIQVNTRGTSGMGLKQLMASANNREQAQVEDILFTIDKLSTNFKLSKTHVGIVGSSLGGYLALRALQLAPTRFRCAVVIDPVIDLKGWTLNAKWSVEDSLPFLQKTYFEALGPVNDSPLLAQAKLITSPVLFMAYPGRSGVERRNDYLTMQSLALKLGSKEGTEIIDINEDYLRGKPISRAKVFRNIEGFFNLNIYQFRSIEGTPTVDEKPFGNAPAEKK